MECGLGGATPVHRPRRSSGLRSTGLLSAQPHSRQPLWYNGLAVGRTEGMKRDAMPRIRIEDLAEGMEVSEEQMRKVSGGFVYRVIEWEGKAVVVFGEGRQGKRLPSGTNTVVANYR